MSQSTDLRLMPYELYLKTEHWKEISQKVIEAANFRCQMCYRRSGLQVHHRTYKRRGYELLSDLTCLCRGCHELFHGHYERAPDGEFVPNSEPSDCKAAEPIGGYDAHWRMPMNNLESLKQGVTLYGSNKMSCLVLEAKQLGLGVACRVLVGKEIRNVHISPSDLR